MQNQGQSQNNQTPQMNDRDYMNDVLSTEKYLSDGFNVAVREASHQGLFQDMMQVLMQTQQNVRDVFDLMYQKGWYKVESANPQQVTQTATQFQSYKNQFPTGQTQ
ncbi:spore coat protein [Alicyclobacillus dauci]|uniref:Spore coat protein n=1 Tax=Alicyclobacillus dauci TaxID=1475485 RepID=A0ABY6Z347_9BACL|nr:spore coat protein [Alicyclobacillus dauci]WAH36395.1 spore coat protein [Alicyclobacillus dauci]